METIGIIGDTHCPVMLDGYVDFLKQTFRDWKVTRVVHIGDLVDWAALSFHGTDPDLPSVRHEFDMANKQIKQLVKAFPKVDLLLGNHDVLPYRRAVAMGLGSNMLRSFHGDQGPQSINAARNQALANFRSTVIGHLHQCGSVSWAVNQDSRVFGMSVGCGVDHHTLAMAYGRAYRFKPFIGCGIVVDGTVPYVEPMLL